MPDSSAIINLDDQRRLSDLRKMLAVSDKGAVLSNISNLTLIIAHDPELSGMCGHDDFQCLDVIHHPAPAPIDGANPMPGPYPRAWGPADVSHVQSYIQRIWAGTAKKGDVEDAMVSVCSMRRFHPIKDWLDGLKWDGKPRLNDWLRKTFGAEDTYYVRDVAACFLIAAVRRVRQPGVKFDHMPVLEGGQGIGKSTAVKTLFGEEFFTDSLPSDLEGKDAALGLQGAWCVEFAEIEQLIRAEVEVIKAFLSRSVDRFRAPYGRTFLSYPRQSVMIGTTNDTDYLRDATGNRRFWPVRCQFVELEWLQENREQLWAEAAQCESEGQAHWIREHDSLIQAAKAQEERQQEDVWDDKISTFTAGRAEITTGEILEYALFIPTERQGKREQMRASSVLKKQGWKRTTIWKGTKAAKVWVRGEGHE
jgi:putative DNA primase/helicase